MNEEKCFCHLNGYAVKDSTARKSIENLSGKVENLSGEVEMNKSNIEGLFNLYNSASGRISNLENADKNINNNISSINSDITLINSEIASLRNIYQNLTLGKPTYLIGTFKLSDNISNIDMYERVICSGATKATITAFKVIKGATRPSIRVQLLYEDGTVTEPEIYTNGSWIGEAWKTFIFDTIVSDTFYNFIHSNIEGTENEGTENEGTENENILNGTYVLNDKISAGFYETKYVQFSCSGGYFVTMVFNGENSLLYSSPDGSSVQVYNGDITGNEGWNGDEYKTITFNNVEADEEFITWLNNNAVKQ